MCLCSKKNMIMDLLKRHMEYALTWQAISCFQSRSQMCWRWLVPMMWILTPAETWSRWLETSWNRFARMSMFSVNVAFCCTVPQSSSLLTAVTSQWMTQLMTPVCVTFRLKGRSYLFQQLVRDRPGMFPAAVRQSSK